MNFGGKKPTVLVFFADAVPTEDEIELVASMPGTVQAMTRNAAAVQFNEKPEKGDYVIAVSDEVIPVNFKDYPRFDASEAKRVVAEQKRDRQTARDQLQAGLSADNGVQPQHPVTGEVRPQIIPGSEAKPDLDAIHGRNPPPVQTEKLGGFPGTAPDGVTSRDPAAAGDGGNPATPAPDAGAVPAGAPPAQTAKGPKPPGWNK